MKNKDGLNRVNEDREEAQEADGCLYFSLLILHAESSSTAILLYRFAVQSYQRM